MDTKRKLQYGQLRHGRTHRRIANPVGRERLNHRRKPQFVYYANAIQRSNEVGGLLVRILGVPHVRRQRIN